MKCLHCGKSDIKFKTCEFCLPSEDYEEQLTEIWVCGDCDSRYTFFENYGKVWFQDIDDSPRWLEPNDIEKLFAKEKPRFHFVFRERVRL